MGWMIRYAALWFAAPWIVGLVALAVVVLGPALILIGLARWLLGRWGNSRRQVGLTQDSSMRCFLDTEFTGMNGVLISLAPVAETGQEFHAEAFDGWTVSDCNEFVIRNVLPHLSWPPVVTMTRATIRDALPRWLDALGGPATIIYTIFGPTGGCWARCSMTRLINWRARVGDRGSPHARILTRGHLNDRKPALDRLGLQ